MTNDSKYFLLLLLQVLSLFTYLHMGLNVHSNLLRLISDGGKGGYLCPTTYSGSRRTSVRPASALLSLQKLCFMDTVL